MPTRLQLSRQRGYRKPEGAIVVSRPSRWGNPFRLYEPYRFVNKHGELLIGVVGSRQYAVELFQQFLDARPDLQAKVRAELGGHDLCCWCKPPEAGERDWCHADVLLEIANHPDLPPA
jgi:hypothetical protein